MKKRVPSGLTLVEVIVTLVVLAVIAAIAIPSFTKYIEEANAKRCIIHRGELMDKYATYLMYQGKKRVDANYGTTAVQAYVDKMYGANQFHCPSSNGGYSMDTAKHTITCSVHGAMDGGDRTVVSLAALQYAFDQVRSGAIKDAAGQIQNKNASIDGIAATDPSTFAYQMMQTFSQDTVDFLNSISWSITTGNTWNKSHYAENSGDPKGNFYIFFTLTHYDAKDSPRGTADNPLVVYKYDMTTKQYKYTTTGKIENGKVTPAGTDWSEWSGTMDAPK